MAGHGHHGIHDVRVIVFRHKARAQRCVYETDIALQGQMSSLVLIPTVIINFLGIKFIASRMGQKKALLFGTYGAIGTSVLMFCLMVWGDPSSFSFANISFFTIEMCIRDRSTIPYGETRSYADIARQIGRPAACRAVGRANGRNPLSIFVPCHRVIGASGQLTGYGGGLDKKEALLRLEGVLL